MAERFRVVSFATVMAQLRESSVLIHLAPSDADPSEVVTAALKDADKQFKELSLSPVLRSQWDRLLKRASEKVPLPEMAILLREINDNLMVELSSAWFLMIPADRRFAYQQPHPLFGEETHQAFPDARRDIAASGRCYALDEWTACVIHCMRALESGLRWLAMRVGLTLNEVKGENWKNF